MTDFIIAIPSDLLRSGMYTTLSSGNKKYRVVASVSTINELRDEVKNHPFAAVILSSRLAGDGTIESWRRLHRRYNDLQLILWAENFQDVLDFQCNTHTVDAFLLANASYEEFERACANTSRGQMYVASAVAEYLAKNPRSQNFRRLMKSLSDRELQVTQMLGRGIRVVDIAKHLNISSKTVNTFRYRIFQKLGVAGDVELTHLAIQSGLVEIDQSQRYD
ncbi:DNA-binding response regulator [Pseudidiomarina gelatinasegens]|jgi:two-component system invasion response regulator UvrY|uniref:DNA-binding response regulator n=1 Tax=Pseudidiomarina gelatinasegens TaxID=2487740 RepID=A0A443Z5U0_9GAMM|nr:LuxR C-terminal-related transcriptional regulator [Pseudidiomarina gelatinasegens]RWU12139.1 DNA-binding response regulator [Pseudidiomarina gelatinasegens]|tara:strand:+ start:241 stop:900 length:660 start_codon:yes stop_codon:yes gene_type:complete